MNKHLEISRYVYLLGLIILPLIISPLSNTPYTLSKTFFLSTFLLISFIFLIIGKKESLKFPNVYITIFFAFDILQGIFFDNNLLFPRYSEHFSISFLIYLTIFLGINIFEKLDLEKIIFYSSILVLITSFLDIFYTDQRVSGTFGQANFLGIFLVISLLVTVKNLKIPLNKYYLIYLVFSIFLIIKTASIASVLSLIIGLLFLRKELLKFEKKFILFSAIVFFLTALFFGNIFVSKTKDVYNQIFSPSQTIISDSFLIRKQIWSITINNITNYPSNLILGFGSNNFENFFEFFRKDNLSMYSEKNLIFDKPHNYYLEIIFNKGVLGFLLFALIVYKSYIKNKEFNFILVSLLIFLFFNWLDLYLKVIFFLILVLKLEPLIIVKNFEKFLKMLFLIFLTLVTVYYGSLFYYDTKSYLGNQNYIFSIEKKDLVNLKYQNPTIYILSINNFTEEENRKIFDFLIKNFPDNKAILFHFDKLF